MPRRTLPVLGGRGRGGVWPTRGGREERHDPHELDAVVAHLYGLTEAQLVHVFETFHEGWDFRERLDAVLGHFRSWGKRR